MPRRDGTGPEGWGSMTGRAAGFCSDVSMLTPFRPMHDPWYGCGPGRRRGRRACRGWSGFDNEYGLTGFRSNRQQEQATLKDRAEYLESVLNRIKKRVADLEGETESR